MSTDIEMNTRLRPSTIWLPGTVDDRAEATSKAVEFWSWPRRFGVLTTLAVGFVLLSGAKLDLGLNESRLGLATHESLGPLGQVFGGWDPSIWVGRLVPSLIWSWGEGYFPTSASVRWPEAIAGVALGFLLARRGSVHLNGRTGVLVGVCWFGSLGLIDRSSGTGLDLITGLWTVAALDRILGRGTDLVAGSLAAVAFLCGGWPPVAVVALATIILGRSSARLSWRLLVPLALVMVGWSIWVLSVAPAEAWAAALTLPLTQGAGWWLVPGVILCGLPWSPFAAMFLSIRVRASLTPSGREFVRGWLQIAGASLFAGTLIPGLAAAAAVPALAGLLIAAAVASDRIIDGVESRAVNRFYLGLSVLMGVIWALTIVVAGGYLAAAVAYYRIFAATLILGSVPVAAMAIISASKRDVRGAWLAVFMLSVTLKLAHWGNYVPEWNYRMSQGPWGRAIGQWVPPRWPIYTTTPWRADLAFATGHPVWQLRSPQHLQYQPGEARYVLLHSTELENWPTDAPKLNKVAEFRDEFDAIRVLARTVGPLPWTRPTGGRDSE